jgi:acetate kinase
MIILVINSGSSSLKFKLFEMPEERILASGKIERIGEAGQAFFDLKSGDRPLLERPVICPNHARALNLALEGITDRGTGCLPDLDAIGVIGHRVVHGRDLFVEPVQVSPEILEKMRSLVDLAPLHLPANISCIEACLNRLPKVPQMAHFDTAFYKGLPRSAYLYPLPLEWYERYGVRRYGFHGISYEYVTERASALLGLP